MASENPDSSRRLHSEKERNSLLRRLDWRIFLAGPAPLRVACKVDVTLESALGLISRQVVALESSPPGSCDMVVATDPDNAVLQAASVTLRTGGYLYAQWASPQICNGRSPKQNLRMAGF